MNQIRLKLDFHSGNPIYLQIVEQIRQLMMSGDLQLGDQLPTVRQLAAEIRVNFNTVARAYRMLDEAGLISTQQGRGTYIMDQPVEGLAGKIKEASLEVRLKRLLAELSREGYSEEEILVELEKMVVDKKIDISASEE